MDEHETAPCHRVQSRGRRALALVVLACLGFAQAARAETRRFDLPFGDARVNLNEFSRQAGLQLLYDFRRLKGMQTPAVRGDFAPLDALSMMLSGLPLSWSFVNSRTLAIRVLDSGVQQPRHTWWRRLLQPLQPAQGVGLDQVVVAGTNLVEEFPPIGASVIQLSRTDIETSGVATAQALLRAQPEVFGGGPSEDTRLGREAITNPSRGSGVNLRGLDAGATLVLIDGQRAAPSGAAGLYTDVANIPLSAIDHVELLPDGASAKHGADAIGGIVNFVLRSTFGGAETQMRDGDFGEDSLGGRQFSQLFGTHWDEANAMVGIEYYDRNALHAADRAQATSDLRPFGGANFNQPYGAGPGTILSGARTWAIPHGSNGRTIKVGDLVAGTENLYDQWAGRNVLPRQQRWSAFGTIRSQVDERIAVFADLMYTNRRVTQLTATSTPLLLIVPASNPFYLNPSGGSGPLVILAGSRGVLGLASNSVDVRSGIVNLGAQWQYRADWNISAHASHSFEKGHALSGGLVDTAALHVALADPNPATALDPFGSVADNSPRILAGITRTGLFDTTSSLTAIGLSLEGTPFVTAAADARLTAGLEYRDQSFVSLEAVLGGASTSPRLPTRQHLRRGVTSVFAELGIPLVIRDSPRRFARRLEFSVGARREKYGDVGQAAVPKVGLEWSPTPNLTLRGTWTRSFRPPALTHLVAASSFSEVLALPDARSPTGFTTVLVANGTNPNLAVERARTWTAGAQLTAGSVGGLSIAMTFFDTLYGGRIDNVPLDINVLNLPAYDWLVMRNYTAAQRAALCGQTVALGAADCLNSPIGAIVDDRLQNIAYLHTRGLDLLGKYAFDAALGGCNVGLNGTYLLDYSQQKMPGSPPLDLLSTQNNPLNFRFRAWLSWEHRGFGASGFINFSNHYRDVLSQPSRNIRSSTTFDLQLRYRTLHSGALLGDVEVALSAQNVFNSLPPFVNNPLGIGYDEENADLTARAISISLRKRW